jgi:FPC/CPF motif-containing protein YcgG
MNYHRNNHETAIAAFHDFIQDQHFPCVAAKSALATEGMRIVVGGDLRDRERDVQFLPAFRGTPDETQAAQEFVSTVILFPLTPPLSESEFERHLWALLQSLFGADRDQFEWDPNVSSDPRSANFAMSLGGTAYFIVGLHPGATRLARRAPLAAVAFNPHSQFRRLREDGQYERLKTVVRQRDIALQGSANPMLADHGETSEAAQYSGRRVGADWRCPFHPHSGTAS